MATIQSKPLPKLERAKPPAADRFYIVLGSMVPLIEDLKSKRLRAYMLHIKDHSHLGGQWLFEQNVPLGLHATVKGLKDSHRICCLAGQDSPLVKTKTLLDATHPAVHACFDLPIPLAIHYRNQNGIKVEDDLNELKCIPKAVSGTRVLEYELENEGNFNVTLVAKATKQAWWANEGRKTTFEKEKVSVGSMHLIDAPRSPNIGSGHNEHEYRMNLSMLGAKKLRILDLPPHARNLNPPAGLTNWEILDYHYRAAISEAMTNSLRTGKPVKAPFGSIDGGGCDGCCVPSDGQTGG